MSNAALIKDAIAEYVAASIMESKGERGGEIRKANAAQGLLSALDRAMPDPRTLGRPR